MTARLSVALAFGACGTTPQDRAISGGAISAAVSGLTSPDEVDLGRPAWRYSAST